MVPADVLTEISRSASTHWTLQDRLDARAPLLRRVVPCSSLSAALCDPSAPGRVTADSAWFHDGDVEWLQEYLDRYLAVDPMRQAAQEATGEPLRLSDCQGVGCDAYTGQFLPRLGIRHVLGSAAYMPTGEVLLFALHRERGRDFTQRHCRLLGELVPFLAEAARGFALAKWVRASVGRRAVGVILFDRHGRASPDCASLSRIDLPRAQACAWWSSLQAHAIRVISAGQPASTVATLLGGDPLEARIRSLDPRSGLGALAVLVPRPAADLRVLVEQLASARGRQALSARESQAVELVLLDHTNEDIARSLGLAEVTVKKHLGAAYRKLGVGDRTELATLLVRTVLHRK